MGAELVFCLKKITDPQAGKQGVLPTLSRKKKKINYVQNKSDVATQKTYRTPCVVLTG